MAESTFIATALSSSAALGLLYLRIQRSWPATAELVGALALAAALGGVGRWVVVLLGGGE